MNTLGQWSRPAVPLIFGVRPNSEEIMISVDSSSPVRSRSRMSVANAWSNAGICPSIPARIWLCMSQPP